jgi:hypothetical protein
MYLMVVSGMPVRGEDLSQAERALWDAFPRAEPVDLRTGRAADDDTARGEAWDDSRSVRAEVIAALLLGAQAGQQGRVPAVRLSGARITGALDLAFAEVPHAAVLRDCFFDQTPRMSGARTARVNLSGSRAPGLQLPDAQVDGLLVLDGCRFDGPVQLTGARVAQTLSLNGAQLRADPGLIAEDLSVGRNLTAAGLVSRGECILSNARVSGTLDLNGAHLKGDNGRALIADGLIAEQGVFCENGFTAVGEVRLAEARIGRQLSMAGASLRNPGATALNAEQLTVDGTLYLHRDFSADGQVMLRGAALRGALYLGGELRNGRGVALNAVRITADGVYARGRLVVRGEVALNGARVRGSLDIAGANLLNQDGTALSGERMEVMGRLFCGAGFIAEGEIRLVDTRVGAGVYFSGARLSSTSGGTLTAWGLTAAGVVNCCDGLISDGKISFAGARIGSELCFASATIRADLSLRQVHADVLRTNGDTVVDGVMDLRHAVVAVVDQSRESKPGVTRLGGFAYTALGSPLPAAVGLAWLASDPDGYHPQPYEQLAAVYRATGNDADARSVLLAKQRARRRTLSAPLKAWGRLQDWIVGYGYLPQRAALWLAALLIIGTAAFAAQHPAPLDPGQAPEFNSLLYTLDLLIPIAGFGQKAAFNPTGWHHWLAAGLIAAGWILATTIAAGITRVLSRQ